jgi:hypothetical protein
MLSIMNFNLKRLFFGLLFVLFSNNIFSQGDTIRKNLSFDFGITRGRNINFWPIYREFKNSEKRELQILYPIFSKTINYNTKSTHFYILPFLINDSSSLGVDKRIFSFYYPSILHFQSRTLSDTYINSFRFIELAPNISCLGISRSPNGLYVDNNLFFFIWYKRDISSDNTRLILFPTYWYFSNKNDTTRLFIPFYYKRTSLYDKRLNIALLYNYEKTRYGYNNVFFPFYWKSKRYLLNDTINKNTLFPIYWSIKNNEKNNKILFPVVYSLKNQSYRSLSVLPLFSEGHSTDLAERHFDLLQIYWYFKNKEGTTNVVFPLWLSTKRYFENDTINRRTIFPIYWSESSNTRKNDIFFPIVYKLRNQYRQSLTVAPLFSYGHSVDWSNRYFTITPLYWHINQSSIKKVILFPLFWSSRLYLLNDTINKNKLFPIYWSVKNNEKNNKILFPVVYSLKNQSYRSLSVLPLFSEGHSTDLAERHFDLLQIYWYFKNKEGSTNIVFPLWLSNKRYYENDTINRRTLIPIYWSESSNTKKNDIFFPIVYKLKNQYRQSLTVAPLFSYGHSVDWGSRYLVITPLYWHINQLNIKKDILFPLFWSSRLNLLNDTINKNTLFPIYWSTKSKEKNNTVLFPLFLGLRNQFYESFTFFPVFSVGHSPSINKTHLMITPIAGLFKSQDKMSAFIFPIYNLKKTKDETKSSILYFLYRKQTKFNYSKTSVIWPICERLKQENYSYLRIAPVVWYKKTDTSKMFSIQPIYYYYKNDYRKTFILSWFLYKYENKKDNSVSNSILWKLYDTKKYTNGDFENRFLYLVYANIDKNGKRETSVLPIYHNVKYANGDKSKSVCLSFYNYIKQFIPEINDFYEEERVFWFVRLRSNYAKLKSEGKGEYLKRK